jgi:hypothetical protein
MPHNKTQKKSKKCGGTLTGNYNRGSTFENYFRTYWGNNQSYNDFVKSLENSKTNYTVGRVMNLFKEDKGHKVMNELNSEKAKQKPPSPRRHLARGQNPRPHWPHRGQPHA